jgi:hypothetical protein
MIACHAVCLSRSAFEADKVFPEISCWHHNCVHTSDELRDAHQRAGEPAIKMSLKGI